MQFMERPYFYKKDEWWTHDKDGKIILTDKAPVKAKLSYQEYFKELNAAWDVKVPAPKK